MAEEFDLLVDDEIFFDYTESPLAEDLIRSSPDSVNSWIGEIESQLMNDDNSHEQLSFSDLDQQTVSEFLADILVDYPTSDSATAQLSDVPSVAGKEKKSEALNGSGSDCQDGAKLETETKGNDDLVAKKRTRRLRNRDAAVRSRERKKEYVQDLERKSKYLERECMRLGRMLDCFVAENHSLRLCLQKGSGDALMTRQESAVLLLESLLLGSLLWYLGSIICQFPQPQDTKSCLPVETQELEKLVLSGQGRSRGPSSTRKIWRCKGSRPRMKHQILTIVA